MGDGFGQHTDGEGSQATVDDTAHTAGAFHLVDVVVAYPYQFALCVLDDIEAFVACFLQGVAHKDSERETETV